MPLAEAWEIVTETEPEWDDEQRTLMQGLAKYESGLCACGWHESLTGDKANHFTFEAKTCPVCAGHSQYERILRDRDAKYEKRLGEDPSPRAKRPSDGRRTFSKLLPPDES